MPQPPQLGRPVGMTTVVIAMVLCLAKSFVLPQQPPAACRSPRYAAPVAQQTDADIRSLVMPMADASRVVVSLPKDICQQLATDCNTLVASFRAIAARSKAREPQEREPSLDFGHQGPALRLDLECNPNLFPDPFKARVSLRLRTADLEVTSEVAFTTLVDALRKVLAEP